MVQSATYVWKIKEYGDEESPSIANERCASGTTTDDYGAFGKRSKII